MSLASLQARLTRGSLWSVDYWSLSFMCISSPFAGIPLQSVLPANKTFMNYWESAKMHLMESWKRHTTRLPSSIIQTQTRYPFNLKCDDGDMCHKRGRRRAAQNYIIAYLVFLCISFFGVILLPKSIRFWSLVSSWQIDILPANVQPLLIRDTPYTSDMSYNFISGRHMSWP